MNKHIHLCLVNAAVAYFSHLFITKILFYRSNLFRDSSLTKSSNLQKNAVQSKKVGRPFIHAAMDLNLIRLITIKLKLT